MKKNYLPILALVFCFNCNTQAINAFNGTTKTSIAKAEKLKEKLNSGELSLSSFAFTERLGRASSRILHDDLLLHC
jgi:hypothetical protein